MLLLKKLLFTDGKRLQLLISQMLTCGLAVKLIAFLFTQFLSLLALNSKNVIKL